ncbi:AraC family transcriptional regulator [Flavobacterium sp.]|uniref:AraC family transcriptional regulator n=1 Tax=Flavobacterium sp. TaxID=239 RepID=UPI003B9D418B
MRAYLEDIPLEKGRQSLYAYRFELPFFEFKWHYHPEYELTYIVRGSGFRLVGNKYETFEAGDLVLLGSHVPHTWSSKEIAGETVEAIVVQFTPALFESLGNLRECARVKLVLENASSGLAFQASAECINDLEEVIQRKDFGKIVQLLLVLDRLTQLSSRRIAPNAAHVTVSKQHEMRINKVCLYIQNRFAEPITLKEVAELIFLTESNFCKFFKKAVGKTFSDYLNEIRINEAARLLLQTDQSVAQIANDCGFETLSYFNRVFLRKKGSAPTAYRKLH